MAASRGPDSVIVIDDDYAIRLSCEQTLAKAGYTVQTFSDGAGGLEAVGRTHPGLVVVDLKMPGLSGLEVIARLQAIDPTITIIVITGYATIGTAVDAMKAGAYDFLPKPFLPDELRLIVQRGFERRRLQLASQQCALDRELERRRFVTFVSHQLKTPLVAVHQYLDVLRQLGDDAAAAARRDEWLHRCLVRTDELRRLIDDWLTLARLEGGTLARERVPLDLRGIAHTVVDAYAPLAGQAQIALREDPAADPCTVTGDRTCLGVLVDNLVSNAVKYNRPGGTVTVRTVRHPGEVVLEVGDTGPGIPPEAVARLFDEFFRYRPAGTPAVEGTGLGLPICRRIAHEHGGIVEVESTPGQGSTFRVRLPETRDPAPPAGGPT